jgi:hypothetical protein
MRLKGRVWTQTDPHPNPAGRPVLGAGLPFHEEQGLYIECAAETNGEFHAVGAALAGSEEKAGVFQELLDNCVRMFVSVLKPHSDVNTAELERRCVGLVGAGEAFAAAVIRGKCNQAQAVASFAMSATDCVLENPERDECFRERSSVRSMISDPLMAQSGRSCTCPRPAVKPTCLAGGLGSQFGLGRHAAFDHRANQTRPHLPSRRAWYDPLARRDLRGQPPRTFWTARSRRHGILAHFESAYRRDP